MGGLLEISQNNLPKRAFRARLLPNFVEQSFQNERFVRGFLEISQNKASKTNVSRDASDNFHRKFAFRHSFVPSTHRILREGSSSKSKMCVSLQRRAIPRFKIHVLLERRTQKCMNQAQEARGNTRHTKITILPQFRTSDQHEVTRGLRERAAKFAFHLSFGRPMSTKRREGCERTQADSHFTSVLDVRRARNDERVATTTCKLRISPQFWTSDEHEVTRGLRRRRTKFAFHLTHDQERLNFNL